MVDDGKIKYQAFVKLNSYDLRIYNGKLYVAETQGGNVLVANYIVTF